MSDSEPLVVSVNDLTPHEEFSALVTILTLCATFNSGGATTLSTRPMESLFTGPLDHPQPYHKIALNALATVLVREQETIAVGAPHIGLWGRMKGEPEPILPVYAIQDTQEALEGLNSFKPRNQDGSYNGSREEVKVIQPGKSYWSGVRDGGWDFIFENIEAIQVLSLADHIATLSSYLNEYKAHPNELNFTRFTYYLVTCSWKKMERRLNRHPLSVDLKRSIMLFKISTHDVSRYFEDFHPVSSGRRDSTLASMLTSMRSDDYVGWIALHPLLTSPDLRLAKLTNLLNACERGGVAYAPEIVEEFHYLLQCALELCSALLSDIRKKSQKASVSEIYPPLWFASNILWRISQSSLFKDHLRFMTTHGAFTSVGFSEAPIYASQAVDLGAEIYSDDLDEDVSELCCYAHDKGLAVQKWLRSITVSLSSASYLSGFSAKYRCGISIYHLTAEGSPKRKSTPWAGVLKRALARIEGPKINPDLAEKAVTWAIQSEMRGVPKILWAFPLGNLQQKSIETPFSLFSRNKLQSQRVRLRERVLLRGSVHCEAALACLSTFQGFDEGLQFEGVRLQIEHIGSSRLCCSACMDLLGVILGSPGLLSDFGIRGQRPTISPTQLPAWLPTKYVEAMLTSFSRRLSVELRQVISLYLKTPENRRASPSPASGSGKFMDNLDLNLRHSRAPRQIEPAPFRPYFRDSV